MTNEDTSFDKYTSHTLFSNGLRKGFERVDVWEASWWREQTATYWPKVLLAIAAPLPHFAGLLNRGSCGLQALCLQADSHAGILSSNWLQLQLQLELCLEVTPASNSNWTQAVCGIWLCHCLSSTCFLWASHLQQIKPRPQVKVIFRYFRPDRPVSWLTIRSKVNMLHLAS